MCKIESQHPQQVIQNEWMQRKWTSTSYLHRAIFTQKNVSSFQIPAYEKRQHLRNDWSQVSQWWRHWLARCTHRLFKWTTNTLCCGGQITLSCTFDLFHFYLPNFCFHMLSGGHNRGLMWPQPPRSPSLSLLGVSELAAASELNQQLPCRLKIRLTQAAVNISGTSNTARLNYQ